jgi:hypothetical protein
MVAAGRVGNWQGRRVQLSDEFLLAAACCRWGPSPARCKVVQEAASRPLDWERFLRIVRRQRVEGLVNDGMKRCQIVAPNFITSRIEEDASTIARQNLAFAAESFRLQRRLSAAGLTFLFVKGTTLDILAYGSLGLKRARDIDLVITPKDVEEACTLLGDAGYVRTVPGPEVTEDQFPVWLKLCKETSWTHARSGIVLELHNGLVDNPALLPSIGARSPRQWVEVGAGIRLPTLQKDELFAYLCVHGATHAWSRLKWIADVSALLSHDPLGERERLYRRSLELGVGRCSAQALLLCQRLFGLQLPDGLSAELRRDAATHWLVSVALRTMGGRNAEIELDDTMLGTVPIHLSHFLLAPGWRYKASEMRRKSLSHHDRSTMNLPRALHFLYPLLLLPSWLWRRVRGAPQL